MKITDKTGKLVAIKLVRDTDNLIITTKNRVVIRMDLEDIRVMGRATQGVRVIRLDENDSIADLAVIFGSEEKGSDEEE